MLLERPTYFITEEGDYYTMFVYYIHVIVTWGHSLVMAQGPNFDTLYCTNIFYLHPMVLKKIFKDFYSSINQKLRHGSHLGCQARLQDTILEEDHPRSITSKFDPIWPSGSLEEDQKVKS